MPPLPNVLTVTLPLMRVDESKVAAAADAWRSAPGGPAEATDRLHDRRADRAVSVRRHRYRTPAGGHRSGRGGRRHALSHHQPTHARGDDPGAAGAAADGRAPLPLDAGCARQPLSRPARAGRRLRRHGRQHLDAGRDRRPAASRLRSSSCRAAGSAGSTCSGGDGSAGCSTPSAPAAGCAAPP